MNQEQTYGSGVALALMATVGWSLSGLFVRLMPGLTGWQINCWRALFMALALIVWLLIRYRGEVWSKVAEVPPVALLAGATFFSLGSTMYVTALTYASTANVACLAATAPLLTAVLSRFMNGETPSRATWFASVLALCGVAYIVRDGLEAGNLLGNVIALCYTASWAIQVNVLRRYRHVDMMPAMILGGLAVFVVAGLFGGGFNVGTDNIQMLAVMGLVQLAVPVILFARSARSIPAVVASLIVLLDVVLNPLWSWLGAGEVPDPRDAIGGGIIVSAVVISVLYGQRSAQVNVRARARHGAV